MGKKVRLDERKWHAQFYNLKEFKKNFGHCDVPQLNMDGSHNKLGAWCANQRKIKKHKMRQYDEEHIRLLDGIGFCWSITDRMFEKNFKSVEHYKNEHGDCRIPRSDRKLSKWCAKLREEKSKGKLNLTRERIRKLDNIGFFWKLPLREELEWRWERKYNEMKKFFSRHNRFPYDKERKVGALASWQRVQRSEYKMGILTKNKIELLNKIGFIWDVHEADWNNLYSLLQHYKKRFGDCDVPAIANQRQYAGLGAWIVSQRFHYRSGKLSPIKIAKMEALGFNWVSPYGKGKFRGQVTNEALLYDLNRIYQTTGRIPRLSDVKKWSKYGFKLFVFRFGGIPNAVKKAGLPEAKQTIWNKNLEELKSFMKVHNGRMPARSDKEHKSLYFWVMNHRRYEKNGELSGEKLKALNDAGFKWEKLHDNHWEKFFNELTLYKQEHGTCRVPDIRDKPLNRRLYAWSRHQRIKYKSKKGLPAEKVEKLNSIGFGW